MKAPNITPGKWEAYLNGCIPIQIHQGGNRSKVVGNIYGGEATVKAIASLPQCLSALEQAHAYFMALPADQHAESNPAHLAVLAALLEAGYTKE